LRWSTIVDGALAPAIARAHDEVVIDFVDHHLEDAISAGHKAARLVMTWGAHMGNFRGRKIVVICQRNRLVSRIFSAHRGE
jgi:hypothetical protein